MERTNYEKPIYEKKCPFCGKTFETEIQSKIYCSVDCKNKYYTAKKIRRYKRKCAICGVEFETTIRSQIYCSEACRNKSKGVKLKKDFIAKKCEYCGKEFKTNLSFQKYCSDGCRLQAIKSKEVTDSSPKEKVTKICPVCGKEFETENPRKVYCSRSCLSKVANAKQRQKKTPSEVLVKKCEVCGKEFETKLESVTTCSKECAYIRHLELNRQRYKLKAESKIKVCLKVCPVCGKEFVPVSRHTTSQIFCSRKCMRQYHYKDYLMGCKQQRLNYDFKNEEYVEIHRDVFTDLLRRIFSREKTSRKSVKNVKNKTLDDWIREADACKLSYGKYRAAVEIFGKTLEELRGK